MSLNTTIPEASARLVNISGIPTEPGFKLIRKWPFIDATYADGLVTGLLNGSATVSNPQADEQTYTGTFVIGEVKGIGQDDRSVEITQELTKVTSVTELSVLAGLTPIKQGLKNVDHPFGDAGGYSTNESLSNTRGLIYTYKFLTGFAVINALTDANFQSLCNSEDSSMQFVDKQLVEMEDHTLTLKLAFRRVIRRTYSASAPDFVEYSDEKNAVYTTARRHWLGYRDADEETIITALRSGGAADNVTDYISVGVDVTDNDDGSKNYTQVLKYARAWPTSPLSTTTPFGADYTEPLNVNGYGEGTRYYYLSYKFATLAALITAQNDIVTAATAGDEIGEGTNNSYGISVRNFTNGIYDLVLTVKSNGGVNLLWTETLYQNKTRYDEIRDKIYNGGETSPNLSGRDVKCYRTVKYTFDIKTVHRHVDAKQFIDGGLQGSGIESYELGGYIATKVKQIDYGAWVKDETGTRTTSSPP